MHFPTLNVVIFVAEGALLLSGLVFASAFPTTLRQRNAKYLEFQLKRSPASRRQVPGNSALTLGHGQANLEYTMPITLGGVDLEVIADLGRCV